MMDVSLALIVRLFVLGTGATKLLGDGGMREYRKIFVKEGIPLGIDRGSITIMIFLFTRCCTKGCLQNSWGDPSQTA